MTVESEVVSERALAICGDPADGVPDRDLGAGVDGAHGVDGFLLAFGVPCLLGVGAAAVVDAGDPGEDAAGGGGRAERVGVGADDVGEGFAAAGGVVVQREEGALRVFGQGFNNAGEVALNVVAGLEIGGCEKRGFADEAGSGGDGLGGDQAFAFSRQGFE